MRHERIPRAFDAFNVFFLWETTSCIKDWFFIAFMILGHADFM